MTIYIFLKKRKNETVVYSQILILIAAVLKITLLLNKITLNVLCSVFEYLTLILCFDSSSFDKKKLDENLTIKEVFKWIYGPIMEELLQVNYKPLVREVFFELTEVGYKPQKGTFNTD